MLARIAILAIFAAAVLTPATAQQIGFGPEKEQDDDPAGIQLRTEAVLVNVVVVKGSDKDFVEGLSATDFSIVEDGVPQAIEYFGAEKTPFAATILLDTSGSMENKLRLARVAAARFMDRTGPEDRVALYLFGSEVRRAQDFTPGGRDLDDSLWDSTAEGVTKMYDCLSTAVEALAARPEFRRAVLLISDGADYGSSVSYDKALDRALAAGVTIYTVDVAPIGGRRPTRNLDEMRARGVLQGLAERSGGRFFISKGGSDLNDAFEQIIEEISHQYTLSYTPTNTKRDGAWRAIGVTAHRPGMKIRARSGYTAPTE